MKAAIDSCYSITQPERKGGSSFTGGLYRAERPVTQVGIRAIVPKRLLFKFEIKEGVLYLPMGFLLKCECHLGDLKSLRHTLRLFVVVYWPRLG